jgi:hypothetical protein
MRYKIKHRWLYDTNKKTKAEQELEIEGYNFTFEQLIKYLDKFAAVVAKSDPKLENRVGEIKSIMEDFIIDVASTNRLK